MAVRETRASMKRLFFFFVCIAVGVAAIVTLRSVIQSVRVVFGQEARALVAADVVISTTRDWTADARRRIDSVDQRLVNLLNERARIVEEVGRIKKTRRLPVTDPRRFFDAYEVELAEEERERLGLPQLTATDIYVTVRASDQLEDFTANLRAPIVISEGRGHQVINQAAEAPLRAPLFGELAEKADAAKGRAA